MHRPLAEPAAARRTINATPSRGCCSEPVFRVRPCFDTLFIYRNTLVVMV